MILASTDSSLKAGMLRTLKARIDLIVHYSSVYDAAMRRHRLSIHRICNCLIKWGET